MKRPSHRRQSGVTMIEVLTALLIFSLGILGLIGLQSQALQFSTSAEDTNRAAMLANDIVSTMWSQQTANVTPVDLANWQAKVADPQLGGLPAGVGQVVIAGNVATVTITWHPPNKPAGAQNDSRYVTQATIQ